MNYPLSLPIYAARINLRGYNVKIGALFHETNAAARALRKIVPELTKKDHAIAAAYHAARKVQLDNAWAIIANNAARETFARDWQFSDYRICAIGREEFSERYKKLLRHCAYNAAKHSAAYRAHLKLSKGQLCK